MAASHISNFTVYNTNIRNSITTSAPRILSAVYFDLNTILIYVVTKYLDLYTNYLQFMALSCLLVSVSGYVGLSNLLYVLILYKFSARFLGPLKIIHGNTNVYSTSVPAALFVARQCCLSPMALLSLKFLQLLHPTLYSFALSVQNLLFGADFYLNILSVPPPQ